MTISPTAGQPAEPSQLVDLDRLTAAYYDTRPDPSVASQRVAFGTSGHRGSAFHAAFNEAHILAVVEATTRYRQRQGTSGPLYLGRDTHALSLPAFGTALDVLAAHDVQVRIDAADGYTPTPGVSHAILRWNRDHPDQQADGIVITPSHNPPEDGGIKYNPPDGGPADTDVTAWIEAEANRLLEADLVGVQRTSIGIDRAGPTIERYDYLDTYVDDLPSIVDLDSVKQSGLKLGVDPMGGASVAYWQAIADRYRLDLTVVNPTVDPTFGFMTLDWDGKIRMDPSSPYAMAGLVKLRDRFNLGFGNDADADRHGIVTPSAGLMNPNHYLAASIAYLFPHRSDWSMNAAVGKTLVSSSLIDRVAADIQRRLVEVPVGFKWFVPGLLDGSLAFGGEESAGASFLRRDGSAWSTDKDGILLCLLAAELTAVLGHDPGQLYEQLTARLGDPVYRRVDARATPRQKELLKRLSADDLQTKELAGEQILNVLTRAPGNDAPIGGLKVVAANGWFAARPSGTEDTYKVYAESFLGERHLDQVLEEAQAMVGAAFAAGVR
jgi:phosphoglucomutase